LPPGWSYPLGRDLIERALRDANAHVDSLPEPIPPGCVRGAATVDCRADPRARSPRQTGPREISPLREQLPLTEHRMNVESFNLDHRTVVAPFVRVADTKALPHGDMLTKYDVRFSQPNADRLPMPTVHSLEHLIAEHIRNHSDSVIDVSPMGCQTGFYVLVEGPHSYDDFLDLLQATLVDVTRATEVPAANEVQCGWAASHSLPAAQAAATSFLGARAGWSRVTA